ncbi:MAG: ATP synthase F0 subunit C [Bdellovibrionales bacterium]
MNKMMFALVTVFAALPAFAQDASSAGTLGFSAALAISVAALGGAFGQGMAASSALEGIARNPAAQPKLFVPMIIGLALIESLVIYAFVIAFQLVGKIA